MFSFLLHAQYISSWSDCSLSPVKSTDQLGKRKKNYQLSLLANTSMFLGLIALVFFFSHSIIEVQSFKNPYSKLDSGYIYDNLKNISPGAGNEVVFSNDNICNLAQ